MKKKLFDQYFISTFAPISLSILDYYYMVDGKLHKRFVSLSDFKDNWTDEDGSKKENHDAIKSYFENVVFVWLSDSSEKTLREHYDSCDNHEAFCEIISKLSVLEEEKKIVIQFPDHIDAKLNRIKEGKENYCPWESKKKFDSFINGLCSWIDG
jgi:hypothetical protein